MAAQVARSPRPGPGPLPRCWTQVLHSPPGELYQSLPSLLCLPGLPRVPPQPELQHRKQQSSSDKEKVLHFGRDQVRWGEVQGRGPLAFAPTPTSPLSPTPSEVRSGMGADLTLSFPLPARFQSSLQPLLLALAKGGWGLPSVTTFCPPSATGLRGTSRPLLNCHTPLLSPHIPESPDPRRLEGSPRLSLSRAQLGD